MKAFFRKLFRRKPKTIPMDIEIPAEMFYDIMDPHGDGSLREGDPMWEVLNHTMTTGKPVVGHFDENGKLVYSEMPE